MSDITTTLLTYLIHNRIIDENTASKIKEELKRMMLRCKTDSMVQALRSSLEQIQKYANDALNITK